MSEVDDRCREDEPLFRQGWAEGLRYVVASLGSRMEPGAAAWLKANTERIDAEQSVPAAAVPEAQDGREALARMCRRHPTGEQFADAEVIYAALPSAAVREGERERLAAILRLCDEVEADQESTNAVWTSAIRSLAAPEGTEQ